VIALQGSARLRRKITRQTGFAAAMRHATGFAAKRCHCRGKRSVMLTLKEGLLGFVLALLVTAFASAGFAATPDTQATRECSAQAAKHNDYTEEVQHLSTFRACMGQHGQPD